MTSPCRYEGRRGVVTGGASGVGAELLDVLAGLGAAHVTVLDLKQPSGPHDAFVEANLSDEAAVRGAIGSVDGEVHALFNNAGVADTQPAPTVIAVNYCALRTLAEGLLGRMPVGSAIVNTASTAGNLWRKYTKPIDELLAVDVADSWKPALDWFAEHQADFPEGPYNFSKAVVVRYTQRSSRPAMRKGVRTNAACPGPIDTPLLKDFRATATDKIIDWNIREMAGRAVSPREVATTLAFLGSPAASYINGIDVAIDGGFFAAMGTGQVDMSGRS
jgi:NAD(P)-dependent dehydrogenase (short-subunit alcohol dehydrogenase family)